MTRRWIDIHSDKNFSADAQYHVDISTIFTVAGAGRQWIHGWSSVGMHGVPVSEKYRGILSGGIYEQYISHQAQFTQIRVYFSVINMIEVWHSTM